MCPVASISALPTSPNRRAYCVDICVDLESACMAAAVTASSVMTPPSSDGEARRESLGPELRAARGRYDGGRDHAVAWVGAVGDE